MLTELEMIKEEVLSKYTAEAEVQVRAELQGRRRSCRCRGRGSSSGRASRGAARGGRGCRCACGRREEAAADARVRQWRASVPLSRANADYYGARQQVPGV